MAYQAGWRRFFAIFIDGIILLIVFVILGIITGNAHGSSVSLSGAPALINFLIDFLYFIVLEALYGQTVGKMVTGIRVVKDDGSPIGWGGSVARNILRFVDGFPYVIPYLVGAIVMWVSSKKQRIGDLAGGTVVVPADAVSTAPVSAP